MQPHPFSLSHARPSAALCIHAIGNGFLHLNTLIHVLIYMCMLKSVYITCMFLYHRSIMIPAALVFMLLTVTTRSAPCSTLQSCVDDATAANSTLNVILPPVLHASTGNCNVSIIGNSNFNRAVVSGSGSSLTIIDCTASGLCLFRHVPPIHAVYS